MNNRLKANVPGVLGQDPEFVQVVPHYQNVSTAASVLCRGAISTSNATCNRQIIGVLTPVKPAEPTRSCQQRGPSMPEVTLKVEMACSGCSGAVERVLKKMEGVESFEVSLEQQRAVVRGNVTPEAVLAAVSKTGKKAELVQ